MNKHLYGENMININKETIELVAEAIKEASDIFGDHVEAENLNEAFDENLNQHILDIAKMLVQIEMSRK